MRIQLANYQYTGSYAKLRNAGNKSFPYSVKVEGFGTSKTKGSLFDFAGVSITEHFEKINMELALLTDLDYILRQVVVKKRVIILKFLRKR